MKQRHEYSGQPIKPSLVEASPLCVCVCVCLCNNEVKGQSKSNNSLLIRC